MRRMHNRIVIGVIAMITGRVVMIRLIVEGCAESAKLLL